MSNALATINPATAREACISLQLGERQFGLPMTVVRDVSRRTPIATVPLAPASVLGITHARGRMVTVIDLRRLTGLPEQRNDRQVMAVVEHNGDLYGLLADAVNDVLPLAQDAREAVPENFPSAWRAIAGSIFPLKDGGNFVVLDMDKLIAALK